METLFPLPEARDASFLLPIPTGWRHQDYDSCGRMFRRAIDLDGCRWYCVDGRWKLYVPGFRRSPRCRQSDDIACVDHVDGTLECHISEAGTIHIGARRIGSRSWLH